MESEEKVSRSASPSSDSGSPQQPTESPPQSPSVSRTSSPDPIVCDTENRCPICGDKFKQPLVLQCLHVFCSQCVTKLLDAGKDTQTDSDNDNIEPGELHELGTEKSGSGTEKSGSEKVTCPECRQDTPVGAGGVGSLPQDHVMGNMMDMTAIEEMKIICTSCKAKEKAVARCSDCANFLCPNCVTAHQYMRCFENHKV